MEQTNTKNNTKTVAIIIVLLALAGGLYLSTNKQSDIVDTNTESENNTLNPSATSTEQILIEKDTVTAPIINKGVATPVKNPSLELVKYSGQFFPFEFSYFASFRPTKSVAVNTKDNESVTYSFNRLAYNGGVGGYFSLYVSRDNDSKYKELVKTYPDKYSIVNINGYKMYKYAEIMDNANKELRVEYITFKDGVEYRFALVAVNGERNKSDIKFYQNEIDIMDIIIKTLKIN